MASTLGVSVGAVFRGPTGALSNNVERRGAAIVAADLVPLAVDPSESPVEFDEAHLSP